MEWCSESNPRKKFKKDESEKSDDLRSKSLLQIFIENVWNDRDGPCTGCEDAELTNWIETVNLDLNNQLWLYSDQLEILIEPKILLTDSIKSNEILLRESKEKNRAITCAQLAYKLRKVLTFLINCNDDVKYTDEEGRTILHIVVEEFFETKSNFSQEQLSKMHSLVTKLISKGASVYTRDKRESSTIQLAACCQPEILELILSCSLEADVRDEEGSVATVFFIILIFEQTEENERVIDLLRFMSFFKNREIIRDIVSTLCDKVTCDSDGNTALHHIFHECINENNEHKPSYTKMIETLVTNCADVNAKNKNNMAPVHFAAEKFHIEALKMFADNGADFSVRTNDEETALHFACKSSLKLRDTSKMIETINFLVSRGCEVEAVDKKGLMPLHYAAQFGIIEIVEALINLGANVDCQTKLLLTTPLHLSAKNDRLDIMRKLLEVGANVNAEAVDGATPIFMSALMGSFESMQYLIDQGAALYRREKLRGFILLHLVADHIESSKVDTSESGNEQRTNEDEDVKKLEVLISKDFNVNDPGTCGITPLLLASMTNKAKLVDILIKHGANVNFQSDQSELTALHVALLERNEKVAEILINAGADIKSPGGNEQWTPLHSALIGNAIWKLGKYDDSVMYRKIPSSLINYQVVSGRSLDCVKLDTLKMLIKNGADVNVKDASCRSPLHLVSVNSSLSKILLEAGAHVNVQDNQKQLPLMECIKYNRFESLEILLLFGANINDHDISHEIMKRGGTLKDIVIEHAIKLKMLELPIAEIYKPSTQELKYVNFSVLCLREVKNLQNYHFGNFSLFQFLRMNVKRQYHFVERITKSFDSLKKKFPMFFCMIHGACHEAVCRNALLQPARMAWTKTSKIYLPDVCVENILSHLNNRYLEALIDSAKLDENISIHGKKVPVIQGWIGANEILYVYENEDPHRYTHAYRYA